MYRRFLVGLLAVSASWVQDAGAQSLRGSRTSVDLMYRQAKSHQLHFYETGSAVRKAAARGTLVELRSSRNFQLGSVSHPYVLPTTERFVQRLGAQYRQACGEILVVTSAARPTSQRLANSVAKSVHPTGMAIDLRKPTKSSCLSWLRKTLSHLDGEGAIEATEERNPPHFHVAVFPRPYERYVGAGRGVRLAVDAAPAESSTPKAKSGGSRAYKVRRGDSLWTIARASQVSVARIKSENDLHSTRIKVGQVLRIPTAD